MRTTQTSKPRPNATTWIAGLLLSILVVQGEANADDSTLQDVGDILQFAIPAAGGFYALGIDDKEGQLQFALGLGTQLVTTNTVKNLVDKTRPNRGKQSFPSGHTAGAFQGAAFIQRRYGWELGAPAYALAALTGYSRVEATKHDFWDVFGGATMGIASAYAWTTPYQIGDSQLSVTPIFDGDAYGVNFRLGESRMNIGYQEPAISPEQIISENRYRNTLVYTGTDPTRFATRLTLSGAFLDQTGEAEPDAQRITGYIVDGRFDWAINAKNKVGFQAGWVKNTADEFNASGIGDMLASYSYKFYEDLEVDWYEPRAATVGIDALFPSGDPDEGTGTGTLLLRPRITAAWTPFRNFSFYPTLSYIQSVYEDDSPLAFQTSILSFEPKVEYKFPNGIYLFYAPNLLFDTDGGENVADHRFQIGWQFDEHFGVFLEYNLIGREVLLPGQPAEGGTRPRFYDDAAVVGFRYTF